MKRAQQDLDSDTKAAIYIKNLFQLHDGSPDIVNIERFVKLRSKHRALTRHLENFCGIGIERCRKEYNTDFIFSRLSKIPEDICSKFPEDDLAFVDVASEEQITSSQASSTTIMEVITPHLHGNPYAVMIDGSEDVDVGDELACAEFNKTKLNLNSTLTDNKTKKSVLRRQRFDELTEKSKKQAANIIHPQIIDIYKSQVYLDNKEIFDILKFIMVLHFISYFTDPVISFFQGCVATAVSTFSAATSSSTPSTNIIPAATGAPSPPSFTGTKRNQSVISSRCCECISTEKWDLFQKQNSGYNTFDDKEKVNIVDLLEHCGTPQDLNYGLNDLKSLNARYAMITPKHIYRWRASVAKSLSLKKGRKVNNEFESDVWSNLVICVFENPEVAKQNNVEVEKLASAQETKKSKTETRTAATVTIQTEDDSGIKILYNVTYSYDVIREQARAVQQDDKYRNDLYVQRLKFSNHWVLNFLKRRRFSWRRITREAKNLPSEEDVNYKMIKTKELLLMANIV